MAATPAVKIFGVGNAGVSLLAALAVPEFAAAHLIAINTDAPSLAVSAAPVKIQLENKLLKAKVPSSYHQNGLSSVRDSK